VNFIDNIRFVKLSTFKNFFFKLVSSKKLFCTHINLLAANLSLFLHFSPQNFDLIRQEAKRRENKHAFFSSKPPD